MFTTRAFLVAVLIHVVTSEGSHVVSKDRSPYQKFLSLFTMIRFPNDPCQATVAGNPRTGTCYSSGECSRFGGENDGTCAQGFGVCCVVTNGCDTSSSANSTYFEDTFTGVGTCTFTVTNLADDICQLRLDFEEFNLAQPTAGTCTADVFTATGLDLGPVDTLCGNNAEQHAYIDVGPNPGDVKLEVRATADFSSRKWRIRVSHIECSNSNKAPPGCTQYFSESTGQIKSFNFPDAAQTANVHLNDKNYPICFKKTTSANNIKFEACTTNAKSFSLSGNGADPAATADIDDECTSDMLVIPCGTTSTTPTGCADERFCGVVLSTDTTATASDPIFAPLPTTLRFISDEADAEMVPDPADPTMMIPGDIENNGFCLNYAQV